MRLDISGLQVESFAIASEGDVSEPIPDTGQEKDTIYYPCPLPDTYFAPCTRNPTPCVNCA